MPEHHQETRGTIALVVDGSQSAEEYWSETRQAALELHSRLTKGAEVSLRLLGYSQPLTISDLESSLPLRQGCSLIAPSLEKLAQRQSLRMVIVIGSGEVFDLEDWIEHPLIDSWLLVKSGPDSLQNSANRLPEIAASQIDQIAHFLRRPPTPRNSIDYSPRLRSNEPTYQWEIDASGYPLVHIDPLGIWMHLFPVTKAQFERFIAAAPRSGFDDEWYSALLELNLRASFRSRDLAHYERLFITGVTFEEAISFGLWVGPDYSLLDVEQWRACFRWLDGKKAPALPSALFGGLARDARAIWNVIEDRLRPRTLLELSLMSRGVMEWTVDLSKGYVGLGDPRPESPFPPRLREWADIVKPLTARPIDFGFRLCKRRM